ncbi:hypothetical protein A3F00_01155 [Candidatus Daviesbacteria bacterium RIFCSPHIGHO2_12_FULL_37_11]|uniref:Uncharacterized protein n=1 Tax=Candidatus Daviesbacteria bacterium RIFCSPHIGHO2_12_FULL_37_11 TaxID=1797777 RepID=A0A1F5KDQ3_9BACT|nr:MAG: hypothetical protein A2111_02525 [Candidatus Daviesbacteria bacterium GWA1_38_6]OGE39082.1 MAG: hypothetical protein A3F00_01155 [Candidatus Daviesbacteria bacterium RIFCSPHIGHO2_12_FULL_37_11]OGE44797.1 MAG: hypothetical protein A3B39_03230 [Candidatus Daviesbacteria bacterium RIFCSPLOWO2_01_FULL_37_10]
MNLLIAQNIIAGSVLVVQLLMPIQKEHVLSQNEISLNQRHAVKNVNEVFKDNILLNLAYLDGRVKSKADINWDEIRKPSVFAFKLKPGETFAYHEDVLPKYEVRLIRTSNAHFNAAEGFKFSGLLYGDGVCHLASLMHKGAKDAGLDSYSPVRHDFAAVPQIEKEYGVSIFNMPGNKNANAMQNLYITNTKDKNIIFRFDYKGENLKLSVLELD